MQVSIWLMRITGRCRNAMCADGAKAHGGEVHAEGRMHFAA